MSDKIQLPKGVRANRIQVKDIIVLHYQPAHHSAARMMRIARELAERTGCAVFRLPDGIALSSIDEAEMERLGWIRKGR